VEEALSAKQVALPQIVDVDGNPELFEHTREQERPFGHAEAAWNHETVRSV